MATTIGGGGLMTVGTPLQQVGIRTRGRGDPGQRMSIDEAKRVAAEKAMAIAREAKAVEQAKQKAIEEQRAKAEARRLELLTKQKATQEFAALSKLEQQKQLREQGEERRVAGILRRDPTTKLDPRHEAVRERIASLKEIPKQKAVTPTIVMEEKKKPVRDFFFGATGERFIGVGIPGIPMPLITARKIKTELQEVPGKVGFPARVTAELIPTTPGEVAITGGAAALFPALPKVIQIGAGAVVTGIQAPKVFDSSLTIEQRTASGIIGTVAAIGTVAEVMPFARGLKAQTIGRIKGEFAPTKVQPEGFKAIQLKKVFRVSPEQKAIKLAKEGKIIFEPKAKLPKGVRGQIEFPLKQFEGKVLPRIQISKRYQEAFGLFKKGGSLGQKGKQITSLKELKGIRQETIAHELVHLKTPKLISKFGRRLPYELQPSEKLAFGLQKSFAKRGFKTEKITRIGLIQPGAPAKPTFITELKLGVIPLVTPLKPLRVGKVVPLTTKVKLPPISPLKRGGFGVQSSEKALFLGKGQTVATSQRGLFKVGKTITPKPGEPMEFFVSPQEPFVKIPEARLSRLGLVDLFKSQRQTQLGFGLPKKPQIGLEFGAKVSRVEKGGAFRIGTGTELEAIKTLPIITVQKKLGVATIKGQAVDIFKIKTSPAKGFGKITTPKVSTIPSARVSGEITLTTAAASGRISTPTTKSPVTKVVFSSPTIQSTKVVLPPSRSSTKPVKLISPPIKQIVPVSSSIIRISPPIKKSVKISPPVTRISPPIRSPTITKTRIPPRLRMGKRTRSLTPTYSVQVRRFGKFLPIAKGVTFAQAVEIGRGRVGRTLAATFKLTPEFGRAARGLRTPKGFRRKPTKTGIEFIERRGLRLSTQPETKEIQFFQKKKPKKKKQKGGKKK